GKNPLLDEWKEPFGVPPFARIRPEHFMPAFDRAFAEHNAEVGAIASDPAAPDFENTIAALELSGRPLGRISDVFGILAGTHSNAALLEGDGDRPPRQARRWNGVMLNAALFRRVDAVMRQRDALGLTAEQARVLDRYHLMFKRAGAGLAPAAKARLAAINERL